jgi:DNA-binding MarR family transcriptional regulator
MRDQTALRTAPRRIIGRRPDVSVRAWLRLIRAYQKISQVAADDLRREGLSAGQFDVLAQVGAAEGSTQQQVADALLVTKSNVCQLLDRMERAGLVRREQHGRTNHLYLTTEGKRLYDRVIPSHERKIAEMLSVLSIEEQSELLGLLRKLDHSLA